jgi:predicted nucleic acid-binding Zn ribbon protein
MALEGLNNVLTKLKQTHWKDHQSFEKFVQLWPEIVGVAVAAQTRPVKLNAKGTLYVAVSSGTWAQNLAFERVRILKKVNVAWNGSVDDIYFSTRDWHRSASPQRRQGLDLDLLSISARNSRGVRMLGTKLSQPQNSQEAFSRWSLAVQTKAQGNAPCPMCQCPTPLVELKRWNHCSLCLSRAYSLSQGE